MCAPKAESQHSWVSRGRNNTRSTPFWAWPDGRQHGSVGMIVYFNGVVVATFSAKSVIIDFSVCYFHPIYDACNNRVTNFLEFYASKGPLRYSCLPA